MGVDHDAFLGIGKRFGSKEEVKVFLKECAKLDDEQIEVLFDGGYALPSFLQVKCLDLYSGEDWFVGFPADCDAPDILSDDIATSAEMWEALFPMFECRAILAVIYS